ncbi:MAG: hypothetical protein SFH39_18590 [Candidatus Magnetobacterium sp. LHC-1]|uniref:Uncharacterized protein n=1 Tax=Candidatus Magnetobacterium casense TaxID=1455061 RepID=A0ABS6RWL4_9BACT|nr:hypothetical protein [Candidatus Magnetobacterium casensis]MBF0608090.1 hypothetical protein [Nitrospirota bacterium]MBV6341024.1 hypothetical protein [Candidatus Magnetobacterium casensis]
MKYKEDTVVGSCIGAGRARWLSCEDRQDDAVASGINLSNGKGANFNGVSFMGLII